MKLIENTVRVLVLFKEGLKRALFLCLSVTLVLTAGCAGSPPLIEQATAVEAQRYAKQNYGAKYAANSYRKGRIYLNKAHAYYGNRLYSKAKQAYDAARIYFERSETKARVLQIKRGGEF